MVPKPPPRRKQRDEAQKPAASDAFGRVDLEVRLRSAEDLLRVLEFVANGLCCNTIDLSRAKTLVGIVNVASGLRAPEKDKDDTNSTEAFLRADILGDDESSDSD